MAQVYFRRPEEKLEGINRIWKKIIVSQLGGQRRNYKNREETSSYIR
jgi:hypothetical protein